jgi:hypothetical protein
MGLLPVYIVSGGYRASDGGGGDAAGGGGDATGGGGGDVTGGGGEATGGGGVPVDTVIGALAASSVSESLANSRASYVPAGVVTGIA